MIGIGPSQGQSLPASERIRGRGQGGGALLKWGDCTIMLGQYIGVLAIELRLLIESGSDYTKTAEELFFAMWAFNRLDLAGEPHWGQPPNTAELNGFFIRDDVPGSLLAPSLNHLNAGISEPSYQVSQFESDFMAPEHKKAEMSIDQCYWMLCGLSLVDKYVPANLFYAPPWGPNGAPIAVPFQDGVYGFVDEATKITLRMIKWMRQRNEFGWTWIIDNPHDYQPVGRGGDNALPLSHGLKQVYTNITGGNLVMKPSHMGVSDWIGYYVSRGLWATSATHADYVWQEEFKAIQIGALANSWFEYLPFTDRNKLNNRNITKRAHIINHHWVGLLHSALWVAPDDNFPSNNPNMRWACKPGQPYYDE